MPFPATSGSSSYHSVSVSPVLLALFLLICLDFNHKEYATFAPCDSIPWPAPLEESTVFCWADPGVTLVRVVRSNPLK